MNANMHPEGYIMAEIKWAADSVERRSVADLIPYDRNPKIHPQSQIEQLANSIKEWGWTIPILIDEDGQVIAGHGRLFAAQHLGIQEVPCMIAEGWTAEQKRAYVIADNKLAESSDWDTGIYFQELKAISEEGFDMSLMGLSDDLSFLDYRPALEPTMNIRSVDDEALERASGNMANQIEGIKMDRADSAMEVICPHCAEVFKISGY